MKILAIEIGARAIGVYALARGESADNYDCPTADFLNELETNNEREWNQINRYLGWSQDRFITNKDQFKPIGDGLFEFRGHAGARLFCFQDGGALLLCTNGYVKKKQKLNPREIEKALAWKDAYFKAKETKTLLFVK